MAYFLGSQWACPLREASAPPAAVAPGFRVLCGRRGESAAGGRGPTPANEVQLRCAVRSFAQRGAGWVQSGAVALGGRAAGPEEPRGGQLPRLRPPCSGVRGFIGVQPRRVRGPAWAHPVAPGDMHGVGVTRMRESWCGVCGSVDFPQGFPPAP